MGNENQTVENQPKQYGSTDAIQSRIEHETRLRKLSNAIHSAESVDAILIGLRDKILELYNAELTTIYLMDGKRNQIFSRAKKAEEDLKEIRIPINTKSLAGYVAATGKMINIKDVYDKNELMGIDPGLGFDQSWDKKTGFKTTQVLAVPILFKKKILGVIQLINCTSSDVFMLEDQQLLTDISEVLGIAFHNLMRIIRQKKTTRFDLLIKNAVITEKELGEAMEAARAKGLQIETVLVRKFNIAKRQLLESFSSFYKTPFETFTEEPYDPGPLAGGIKMEYFMRSRWVPLKKENDHIAIAIDDPKDQFRIQEISTALGTSSLTFRVALREDIDAFINTYKRTKAPVILKSERDFDDVLDKMHDDIPTEEDDASPAEMAYVDETEESGAAVQLVRKIMDTAHIKGASDIHIEPYGTYKDTDVRFRIDGSCIDVLKIPKNHIKPVISRLKILADLDIAERRRPQDGKIQFKTADSEAIEFRVATIPTAGGNEDVVMRRLASSDPSSGIMPLSEIMSETAYELFSKIIQKPHGIILVVGPTGSGKTTTLHSALNLINTPARKIWTAEDPVEITQYRLRQVQVNPKIDFTFASAMRSFLRADPDVIMVGEMRDKETMQTAVEASLTGHLVFSTLHTNSAPETIVRLIDMGIDPLNFGDALICILAQRLVRTLCSKCKEAYHPDEQEYNHYKELYGEFFDERINTPFSDDLTLYRAKGCEMCRDTEGYRGRLGIHELLVNTNTLKKMIVRKALVDEVRPQAIIEGMSTLLQDGIHRIFTGDTDFKQVASVCSM